MSGLVNMMLSALFSTSDMKKFANVGPRDGDTVYLQPHLAVDVIERDLCGAEKQLFLQDLL